MGLGEKKISVLFLTSGSKEKEKSHARKGSVTGVLFTIGLGREQKMIVFVGDGETEKVMLGRICYRGSFHERERKENDRVGEPEEEKRNNRVASRGGGTERKESSKFVV